MADNIDEILDFAIAREKEAVAFYASLKGSARFENQKSLLAEFELMEQGHVTMLEKFKTAGIPDAEPAEITNLKISDYLLEVEITDDMDYQEILITAMKREEKALALYTRLAGWYKAPEARKVFTLLAAEEAKHKHHFEELYDDEILQED